MAARDLLFEIGTEEIPARFMPKTLSDLRAFTKEEFDGASLEYGEISVRCTPRRIVLFVSALDEAQKDSVEVAKGPLKAQAFDADGNPTKAAEGFAKSKGISASELQVREIGKAEYVVAEIKRTGRLTAEILPAILERIINRLSFPKSMYWADPAIRFARPVRWIIALFGADVLNVSFGDVVSGTHSRGHRFMGAEQIEIKTPADYEPAMKKNFVMTDPEERRQEILKGIAELEKELNAKVDVDEALLEENVHLVEYPVVFYGSFDESFLEIPEEVLTLSMAKNQRYFPVRDASGKLRANFIGVSNNKAKNMQVVREGNERVLRARLYDASFFWNEDQKKDLDAYAEELKNVTYQVQLGSVHDKVQRVKSLALWLTEQLGKTELKNFVGRAASIAKADLVTNMVYEFADVQGVMGREYARRAGEPEEVALAIYEQYLPRNAGDDIPSGYVGAILGLSERADTIAAIFKIGLEPTSSQDPYGLRRAARCINEILWGLELDIDTQTLIEKAAEPLSLSRETLDKIAEFLKQRLQVQLREKGLAHEVVALSLQTVPSRPLQAYRMSQVLQKSSDAPWFGELVTAAVRVKNLLNKADDMGSDVDPQKFTSDAEHELYKKLSELTEGVRDSVSRNDWETLAASLAELAPVIAKFFNDVLVMDDDESVRKNRLALLAKAQELFLLVGDFSLLK